MERKPDLAGLTVLLVEDDFMVSMLAEDVLTEAGAKVVLAMRLGAAMAIAAGDGVQVAVLDVNLGDGQTSYPVAERLRGKGVPFLFLTGYGDSGLDRQFEASPRLAKPYPPQELVKAVAALARQGDDLSAGSSA